MHNETIEHWVHDHIFGQDAKKSGERRTLIVIGVTVAMMALEIAAGLVFRSMALLADGLHMASHASALTISAFAYYYTRRHARDTRFNFGTGKINSLAAFASAVLVVVFALIMAWGSIQRIVSPVGIDFNQAILVAIVGLVVNGVCLLVLGGGGDDHSHHVQEDRGHGDPRHFHVHHADHNLWSAYLHVLADALTSVLAIIALLAGKYLGLIWMDPLMGLVGAVLVSRWSWGLIRSSGHVLLDMRVDQSMEHAIRLAIESEGDNRVIDLHVWSVGPGIFSAEIGVVSSNPRDPDHYCDLLSSRLGLVHVTVEVHHCPDSHPARISRAG